MRTGSFPGPGFLQSPYPAGKRISPMFKFLGGTVGVIFLIGLIVVILLLMLIF